MVPTRHHPHESKQEDEDGYLGKGRRGDREDRRYNGVLDGQRSLHRVRDGVDVGSHAIANAHCDECGASDRGSLDSGGCCECREPATK